MQPLKRNILLNPGPATTTDTVKQALVVPDICPREQEFGALVGAVRRKLVEVVNGARTHMAVLFAASGTGAVEAVISSVVGPGDRILIHSNGAYGRRMIEIGRVFLAPDQVVVVEQPFGTYPDVARLEELIDRTPRLTHLALVHHETTTGMLNPAHRLVEITRRRGVLLILDAMSSYAGVPMDLQQTPYDFVVSSANKCLQGMPGISFVIANRQCLESSADHPARNYYFNLWRQHQCLERSGQMPFTPPVQVLYALNRALDEYFEETGARRRARYTASWEALVAGLRALHLELLLPLEQHSRILTAVLEPSHPNYSFQTMHDELYARGFTIYPGIIPDLRTFRLANLGAIDRTDIEAFLEVLRTYLDEHGIL
ncbi:MAG TPA: 2-aminoethylphosphonate--pyruvate transaminase [Isosphaeraceae bacterium]|nr:2-aminoethylphosphonate--pyruvate transaminase [Isosphaeraceae bacterium]